MIEIAIPSLKGISIEHLVLDYNGTLAKDGDLLEGVGELLREIGARLAVHVVTADTHGTVKKQLHGLPVRVSIINQTHSEDEAKLAYINKLRADTVMAVGNGRNDLLMLSAAGLGVAVIGAEGVCTKTLLAADVVCARIVDALELLIYPARLVATMRN